jgi:hypothetical protein
MAGKERRETMAVTYDFTEGQIEEYYCALNRALKGKYLLCEDGHTRIANADEFMLMHRDGLEGVIGFKHSYTRNYVFLVPVSDFMGFVLYVPHTDKPLMRGYFDAQPEFVEVARAD